MKPAIGIIGMLLLFALLVWAEKKKRLRKIEGAFAGRAELNDQDFFENHFRASAVPLAVVSKVREILSEQLGANMSRLAGADDFTTNLKFLFDFDSLVDVAIVNALEEEFSIKISDEEAQAMHTIEDIVLSVARHVHRKNDA